VVYDETRAAGSREPARDHASRSFARWASRRPARSWTRNPFRPPPWTRFNTYGADQDHHLEPTRRRASGLDAPRPWSTAFRDDTGVPGRARGGRPPTADRKPPPTRTPSSSAKPDGGRRAAARPLGAARRRRARTTSIVIISPQGRLAGRGEEAHQRLAHTLRAPCARRGLEAVGQVMDPDPFTAIPERASVLRGRTRS